MEIKNIIHLNFYGLYFINTLLMPENIKNFLFLKLLLNIAENFFQNEFLIDMVKETIVKFSGVCSISKIKQFILRRMENFIKKVSMDENSIYQLAIHYNAVWIILVLSDIYKNNFESKFIGKIFIVQLKKKLKSFFKSMMFTGDPDINEYIHSFNMILFNIYEKMKTIFYIESVNTDGDLNKISIDTIKMIFSFIDLLLDENDKIVNSNDGRTLSVLQRVRDPPSRFLNLNW
ncbi:hypothetical protein DMUE_5684 [Dictyocoela muelleri]|nr:hypothetical protein DMUE_5684 [Dictyocoela muelleri]